VLFFVPKTARGAARLGRSLSAKWRKYVKTTLSALLVVILLGASARADTVVFKNGDKLTGTFVEVRDGKLALKSDALGDVSIPLGKVQSFSMEKPAVILGKDRKIVRGQMGLAESGDWQVMTNGTSQTVVAANVAVILPADSYHQLAEVPARPWQNWKGSINFGDSFQHGDQQTNTLTTVVVATRERPSDLLFSRHWRTNYGLTMLFSKAEQGGVTVASDTVSTNLRGDYLFTDRNFVFVSGELDYIQPQGLYLRQSLGGGFGHDVIHSERTVFSLLGGIDYAHEKFINGASEQSAEALAGEKLGMQITRRLRLDHHLNFYPDLQGGGQYRWDTSAALGFKVSNRLVANAGVIDLFLNKPEPGSHQNNIAVTTGLGYTF
jgi:putative salt-induced outer membrane protein